MFRATFSTSHRLLHELTVTGLSPFLRCSTPSSPCKLLLELLDLALCHTCEDFLADVPIFDHPPGYLVNRFSENSK